MLFLNLFERMALAALAAYIFSQTRMFRRLIKDKLKINDKIIMVVFFSIISIAGTYMGINFNGNALANTRPIGAIVAGSFRTGI